MADSLCDVLQLSYHFLQCIFQHAHLTRGQARGAGMVSLASRTFCHKLYYETLDSLRSPTLWCILEAVLGTLFEVCYGYSYSVSGDTTCA